jgi:uncharacterized protein (DUF433 family)
MTLIESLVAHPPPIREDGGVLRIGKTRVRLESVLTAFQNGSPPEQILTKYPSLELTDIYAVITYYLWHRDHVETYMDKRRRAAERIDRENEKRHPSRGVRQRLLARRRQRP